MRFPLITITISLLTLSLFSPARAGTPTTAPSPLPRYHLSLGQELTYESSGSFTYQRGALTSGSKNIYDVVSLNPDGSWHIIARLSSWETQGKRPPQTNTDLVAFDLRPDGVVTASPDASIPAPFPSLPTDQSQWTSSWQHPAPYGGHVTFKPSPSTQPSLVQFSSVHFDPIDPIYLSTNQTTYQFDPARGLLISSASQNAQGYGFVGQGSDSTTLTSTTQQSKDWLDHFSHDCQIYFDATTKSSAITDKAEGSDPAKLDSLFASATEILTTAKSQSKSPQIQTLLEKQIADLPGYAKYLKEEAKDRAAMLNKPAPDWTLTDLNGSKHSLADYKGKVVILDFWYRGCGWCMRAMPQMKKLSTDFSTQPVAILGMNTDHNSVDPKFVVNAFNLDYPILHVEPTLTEQYHVQGFPTVIIIAPTGNISDILIGYSPTIHDDLTTKINALLKPK